ncbi:hypothetical protein [Micromonospora vulcania]|uniref:Uncharacterized protein n=1 Tax=Micromonospora vulcania TaxID=1441873 RepID=A0ABW1H1F5_9ACTN
MSNSEKSKVVRPEDVLPDNADVTVMNGGVPVRKGTIGAFISNAKNLSELESGTPAYDEVVAQLRALTPALTAVGVFDIFEVRSPELREIIADA